MIYVMDTHVLIWYFIGSKRLKRKVEFDFQDMYQLIKNEAEFEIISFTTEILEEVMHTGIPEIHDRIIVATAKFYRVGILTKDKIIRESGEIEKL